MDTINDGSMNLSNGLDGAQQAETCSKCGMELNNGLCVCGLDPENCTCDFEPQAEQE